MNRIKGFLDSNFYIIPMLIIFIISRMLVYKAGVVFDATNILNGMHYIELDLVNNDFIRSLFYFHAQPPLWNFFIGSIVKFFPNHYSIALHIIFLLMSFGIYLMIFILLKNYRIKPIIAFILATVYIIFPEAILYENWVHYTLPTTFIILLTVVFLYKYQHLFYARYALYFILGITTLALMRSTFHFIFIVGALFIVFLVNTGQVKKILLYALIPIVLVLGLYIKNYILFDTFGSSSWLGSNMWRIANYTVYVSENKDENLTRLRIQNLYQSNHVSGAALLKSFSPIDDYPSNYHIVSEKYSNIPVLTRKHKMVGDTNFNYVGWIQIGKDLKKDSFYVIKNNFKDYLKTVAIAWRIYMNPSWDYSKAVLDNYAKIQNYAEYITLQPWRRSFEINILHLKEKFKYPISNLLLLPASLFIIIILFGYEIGNVFKGKKVDYVIIYMVYVIFYIAVLGNAIEIGEAHRFRVVNGPEIYILVIVAITRLGIWKKSV